MLKHDICRIASFNQDYWKCLPDIVRKDKEHMDNTSEHAANIILSHAIRRTACAT